MPEQPTDIKLIRAENVLEMHFAGGAVVRHAVRDLRIACRCAMCVDERTGERILDPASVPQDVSVSDIKLVGNYAVQITFSDGHDTGLFTYERLRSSFGE